MHGFTGARYTTDEGEFPHELDVFIPEETMMILHRIKKMADKRKYSQCGISAGKTQF